MPAKASPGQLRAMSRSLERQLLNLASLEHAARSIHQLFPGSRLCPKQLVPAILSNGSENGNVLREFLAVLCAPESFRELSLGDLEILPRLLKRLLRFCPKSRALERRRIRRLRKRICDELYDRLSEKLEIMAGWPADWQVLPSLLSKSPSSAELLAEFILVDSPRSKKRDLLRALISTMTGEETLKAIKMEELEELRSFFALLSRRCPSRWRVRRRLITCVRKKLDDCAIEDTDHLRSAAVGQQADLESLILWSEQKSRRSRTLGPFDDAVPKLVVQIVRSQNLIRELADLLDRDNVTERRGAARWLHRHWENLDLDVKEVMIIAGALINRQESSRSAHESTCVLALLARAYRALENDGKCRSECGSIKSGMTRIFETHRDDLSIQESFEALRAALNLRT